jgi:hypothetical protein
MSMVGFPLLLIPLAIYNIIVFLMPGVGFTEPLVRVPLVSGELWAVSLGDMLVALGVLLLLLEVIKAARGKFLTEHLLSLLVFGGAAAEFVMWPKFANSTFFLLALMAMVDFFSGIALRAKRGARARAVAPAPVVAPEPASTAAPAPLAPTHVEAVPEPVPAAPAPAAVAESAAPPPAASVAESVPLDHRAPQPASAASEPAPKTETPEPQPVMVTPDPPEPAHPTDSPKP